MDYQAPKFLFHPHLETIYPAIFRRVDVSDYTYERILTSDNDFLDLGWLKSSFKKVVILSHGLEGNMERAYVKGMAKQFFSNGYDVLAWNYRGCGDEMNKQKRFYHSGATDDLHQVVQHALTKGYLEVVMIGFSLGGNLTLKYLGEQPRDERIARAITFSVPLHLHSSCIKISQASNQIYAARFLKSLKKKIIQKAQQRTDIDISKLSSIRTLEEFDDNYTSKLHGYENAIDYYTKCSSLAFVKNIKVPTLIVNALNDPFLSEQCFPVATLERHPFVTLETPTRGGHVGFTLLNKQKIFWSEQRALNFAKHQS
jgi:uncharacterized protein